MINLDPTQSDAVSDFNDPRFRYLPPDGKIGSNPVIYMSNLLMLVLECNCPPSPTGLYAHVEIARAWVPWLQAHPAFDRVAHIEETSDPLTGEERTFLWRLKDWRETASARERERTASVKHEAQWWENRFRMFRAVSHAYDEMGVGWQTAKESVEGWIRMYEQPGLDASLSKTVGDCLKLVRWFEPIDPEEFEEFRRTWHGKKGHLYASPFDLTGHED